MIAPLHVFVAHHRLASATAPLERQSVRRVNLALLAVTALTSVILGVQPRTACL
jgi:hypothetical protein